MKKKFFKLFALIILLSFTISPAIAQPISQQDPQTTPPDFDKPSRPLPELVPQEVRDLFEDGMTIEEFFIQNQGPIPNALIEYAEVPVTVVVQLVDPPLAEYVVQQGLTRDTGEQEAYINQLKSRQANVLNQITASRSEVTVIGETFTKVLNGFMLQVPASALSDIRAIEGVRSVSRAPEHVINLGASVPLIQADDVWSDPGYTGEGISIAVIDTGIDYTHAMFGGPGTSDAYEAIDPDVVAAGTFPTAKVIGGYDFAGTNYDASGQYGSPIPQPDPNPIDENGHGTHVAATAAGFDIGFGAGVAKDAMLYALKIFGEAGSTNLTLHAIEWAMDPKGLGHLGEPVDVINMSLGSNWGPADENDPEFNAVENASALGVVVVASAGNAGNSEYIVGSPSTTDSAISVAASTTGFITAPYIEYTVDTTDYAIPYTPSGNPFTVTITADLIDVTTFDGGLMCDDDITSITGLPLDGAIALIERGVCTFSEKINNAEDLGAVAAIIHNDDRAVAFGMDTTGSTLPAGSITQADGLTLKALTPMEISVGPDSEVDTFVADVPPDTIAPFSSRGPRGFDSKLKPEITGPGVAIFAADMGTGNLGTSLSGTSMAAPHVAGVAALMKQAHPGWTTTQIKAAMMNTAVDLVDPDSAQIPRQGAGRVDALEAVTTSAVAYGDPQLVSLSWGVIEIGDDAYEDTQTVTLRNFSDTPVTLDVSTVFTSDATGAALTPADSTVMVPAYGAVGLDVTLSLDATMLPVDNLWFLEEYYGFVTFEDGSENTLRVPFYFAPRPFAELAEVDALTSFDALTEMGYVDLAHTGPTSSDLWASPVSLVSEQNPAVLDAADLRYIGVDYAGSHSTYGDLIATTFTMWGPTHTLQPFFNEVDLYIDTSYGSVVNFNYNLSWLQGAGQDNLWVVIQVDFSDGMVYLGSPWLIYADFNSGVQEWYLPAAWQYVLDEFEYEVVSFDWDGNFDYGGSARFDISRPPLIWGIAEPEPDNEPTSLLYAVDDVQGYNFADIAGIMLLDYNGKPGYGQSYFWPLDVTGINAYLQVAHLAPFAEDACVSVSLNGADALPNFCYGDSTEYIPLEAGIYDVAITPIGAGAAAIEATIDLAADEYYTAIAVGDGANQDLDLILLNDDLTPPEAGKFHLRLGHLAPFASGDATADIRLRDGTPVLEDVKFGDVTGFIPLDVGTYDLIITTPGGETILINPIPVPFAEGMIISAFATGDADNQPLGVFALPAGEMGDFLPLMEEIFFPLIFN